MKLLMFAERSLQFVTVDTKRHYCRYHLYKKLGRDGLGWSLAFTNLEEWKQFNSIDRLLLVEDNAPLHQIIMAMPISSELIWRALQMKLRAHKAIHNPMGKY